MSWDWGEKTGSLKPFKAQGESERRGPLPPQASTGPSRSHRDVGGSQVPGCMTGGYRGPSSVARFCASCSRLDMPRMTAPPVSTLQGETVTWEPLMHHSNQPCPAPAETWRQILPTSYFIPETIYVLKALPLQADMSSEALPCAARQLGKPGLVT